MKTTSLFLTILCIILYSKQVKAAPANDSLCNSIQFDLFNPELSGNNLGATMEVNEPNPSCHTTVTNHSVWYHFVAPSKNLYVYAHGVTFQYPQVAVYTITDCADLTTATEIGCTTTNSAIVTSVDLYNLTIGATYYVRIVGLNDDEGDFTVGGSVMSPQNNYWCQAVEIKVDSTSAGDAYDLHGAITMIDEPVGSCFANIDRTLWYIFTAPASGQVTVTTDILGGTSTDTEIAVYDIINACTLNETFTELDCDQNSGVLAGDSLSVLSLTGLVAGNDYYIQVNGYKGGTFGLEVNTTSATAVENLESIGFRYFPNPVSNSLYLTANEAISNVTIFNVTGQKIMSFTPSALEAKLNVSSLGSGIYFMKVLVGKIENTFKIVKK